MPRAAGENDSRLLEGAGAAEKLEGDRFDQGAIGVREVKDSLQLEEILATVAVPGAPGGHVRCVVSVGMLTEGWDCRRVTGNRPKSNTESRLTPNGGGSAGERPGSAPERNAAGSQRASRVGVRRLFAPGTPASAAAAPGQVRRSAGRRRRARREPRPPELHRRRRGRRARRDRARRRRGGGLLPGPEPPPPAPPSSRPHNRPGAATAASGSGSMSRPTSPARTRPRRLQRAGRPPGTEDLDGAREAPVAPCYPRRHQPARAARPATPHPARHRAALRRRQGARRRAHEDLRGPSSPTTTSCREPGSP